MTQIAIIGAGIAGLTAAEKLSTHAEVTLFEKSWRAGGRVTTRSKEYEFDHGAQFFSAKTPAFNKFLEPWIEKGVVQVWNAHFVEIDQGLVTSTRHWDSSLPHYVAVPGMTAIGQAMASNLDVQYQTRVDKIEREKDRWQVYSGDTNLGAFDWIVCAAPAPQAVELLPSCFAYLDQLKSVSMKACYSLMLGFPEPLEIGFDAALVKNADISWISVNSSKPGRSTGYSLLIHSTNHWADLNLDLAREQVIQHLIAETEKTINRDLSAADHTGLHRWLYANIERQPGPSAWIDRSRRLAAIGDWCISGRIESAFTSGSQLDILN